MGVVKKKKKKKEATPPLTIKDKLRSSTFQMSWLASKQVNDLTEEASKDFGDDFFLESDRWGEEWRKRNQEIMREKQRGTYL